SDGDGAEGVHRPAAGNDYREDGGGGSDLLAGLVAENFARIYFARQNLRHAVRNVYSAGIVTVDHDSPQRDCLFEHLAHLGLNESGLLRECIRLNSHLATPLGGFIGSVAKPVRSRDSALWMIGPK